jgi:hypothetical protein
MDYQFYHHTNTYDAMIRRSDLVCFIGYFLAILKVVVFHVTKDIYLTNTIFHEITVLFYKYCKRFKC